MIFWRLREKSRNDGISHMSAEITIDEYIETMVTLHYGHSDARTQHLYRQSLHVLVELSKAEQRHETNMETHFDNSGFARGVVH